MAKGNTEANDKELIHQKQTKKPYTKPAFRFE